MPKVIAIACSDLHLRLDTPECRTDDFILAQKKKYRFLRKLQEEHDCSVFCSGDIFHHWKPSPELISFALENLPERMICIAGQHDLEAHNLANIKRSGIYALASAGKIELIMPDDILCDAQHYIEGFPWGAALTNPTHKNSPSIALVHRLVYKGVPPFPGAENCGGTAIATIRKLPGFSFIITGDNHVSFTETYRKQTLVNPGSFLRSTAAQVEHEPSIFLLHSNHNVTQVKIPIDKTVVSRSHIDKSKDKEDRITAFAERLNHRIELSLSFLDNIKATIAKNKISKSVQFIVWEVVDGKQSV